ncbi:MAG: TRAP transporter large permease [Pseudomonadales bacterium]|nr:TRAP transporter large permease [Pseudomonadales bacterium]
MLALGLFSLLAVLLVLRQSVLVMLASATAYAYWAWGDSPLRFILLDAWDALNREVLLSIPLYILAGNLMSRGTMASRLVGLLGAATSFLPGGLALSAVLACAFFAAISGSSTVTLMAVGSIMYPALLKAGYTKRIALGVLCAAGTLGIIVPPSIPLILYGVMTNASIVDLFRAGIGPAIVMTIILGVYVVIASRHIPASQFDVIRLWVALKASVWALMMPIIVLGGIYTGFFTATEAAAVAVFYTLLVQMVIYREMGFRDVYEVSTETTRLIGSLFPILMMAVCLNLFLTYQKIPDELVLILGSYLDDKVSFLLASNLFLLLTGSVMDIGSAILILAPLLKPLATEMGVDPVHFGIMMIVNLEIGYLTPPLGLNLIVAMSAFKESFAEVCKAAVPFILLMLLGLVIVAAFPVLSLFLV